MREMERQGRENRGEGVHKCVCVYCRKRTKRKQIRAKEEGVNREGKRQKARVRDNKRQRESSVWPCILTAWKMARADKGGMLLLWYGNISPSLKRAIAFF